jgi:hypothetical protein
MIFWMVEQGRLGRKAKAGFYAYDDKGKRRACGRGWRRPTPVADEQPDLTEVQHRLLFAQVLEAVRALEEGVLTDIREGDVGAILGWGFAPWSGGPFSWLDMLGAAYAAERCDALTAAYGDRFTCPALLREMAEKRPELLRALDWGRSEGGLTRVRSTRKGGRTAPLLIWVVGGRRCGTEHRSQIVHRKPGERRPVGWREPQAFGALYPSQVIAPHKRRTKPRQSASPPERAVARPAPSA